MKKIFIISLVSTFVITQANAYDFYVSNSDGVRIYYDIQAGSGNKVMVVRRNYADYNGVVNIPDSVTYDGVSY